MGFDLYGLNPNNPKKAVKPKLDWSKATEEETTEYFEQQDKYRNQVVGDYFRSNCWWWRPLADYIIQYTNCVSEEDAKHWGYNDGHVVSEEEAKAIAKQLKHLIKTGHTKKFAKDYEKSRKEAEDYNQKIEKQLEAFQKSVEKKMGKDNIAPNDYPEEDKKKWDSLYEKKSWMANYPFSVNHVTEFVEFAENSGGFRIC
jgi:Asp-tRNA(Asn)/Glu-tRNA(Gln) amidotransferase A subunit family amidase